MKIGVVGLPNVGKSTLFNALTNAGAQSANYPFCTIEPNYGVVSVPDGRLDYLREIYNPKKFTPATVEFVDIAGLVKGASKGEGLGNKFLSHIREVDAIAEVVRCFEDPNVTHVDGRVDPVRDAETINFELIFADLETIEKRFEKAKKLSKGGDKKYALEAAVCEILKAHLEGGAFASTAELTEEQRKAAKDMFLLTDKPVIYVANVSESPTEEELLNAAELAEYAKKQGADTITVCAKIEEELAGLAEDEAAMFKEELNIDESGLDKLIKSAYSLLGLISFLTAGEKEVRAWPITNGSRAPQAAGKIHSDFERGFICAEIIPFEKLKSFNGSLQAAKEAGAVRQEGRDYIMKDGDVTLFRFNV